MITLVKLFIFFFGLAVFLYWASGLGSIEYAVQVRFMAWQLFWHWSSGLGSIEFAVQSLGLGSVMHWSSGLGSIEFAVQVLELGSVDFASQVFKAWQCYALIKRAWQH